jgi:cysteine peptidase C11 family protein
MEIAMADTTSKPSQPKPADTPEPAANITQPVTGAPEKTWTIMVYLAGDNNLADECVFALTEMKAAVGDPHVKVVAQFDPTARRVRTRRFVLNKALYENGNGNNSTGRDLSVQITGAGKGRKSILDDVIEGLPEGSTRFPGGAGKGGARTPSPVGAAGFAAAVAPAVDNEFDTDSGDPKLLFDFISWTVDNHPADHYMIILSGHGSGVLDQEFLRDESSKGTLTIKELGKVFKAVKDVLRDKEGNPLVIDVVGFDSCVMGMAEICYELRDNVKYMVSSESFSPQTGWPYGRIIEGLSANLEKKGSTSPEALARIAIDEHVDFYLEYAKTNGLSVDISLMNVEKIRNLVEVDVKKLATVLKEMLTGAEDLKNRMTQVDLRKSRRVLSDFLDQIVLAHWEAQSYNGEMYVDLRDFCDCLRTRYAPDLIKQVPEGDPDKADIDAEIARRILVGEACTEVINRIEKELVLQSCFMGVTYQYSFGVSIYFPWAEVAPDYNETELSFIAASGWHEFLAKYVSATRREPRGWRTITPSVGVAPFITLDVNVRRTVTDQRGPANVPVRSMRNPPIDIFEEGLSECTKRRLGLMKS